RGLVGRLAGPQEVEVLVLLDQPLESAAGDDAVGFELAVERRPCGVLDVLRRHGAGREAERATERPDQGRSTHDDSSPTPYGRTASREFRAKVTTAGPATPPGSPLPPRPYGAPRGRFPVAFAPEGGRC